MEDFLSLVNIIIWPITVYACVCCICNVANGPLDRMVNFWIQLQQ